MKDVLTNGKIISISDNELTKAGNASFEIIFDSGEIVGTKGEKIFNNSFIALIENDKALAYSYAAEKRN